MSPDPGEAAMTREMQEPRPVTDLSCFDCGSDADWFMLHDAVWFETGMGEEGNLCIACVEDRLGRMVTRGDFADVPLNDPAFSRGRWPPGPSGYEVDWQSDELVSSVRPVPPVRCLPDALRKFDLEAVRQVKTSLDGDPKSIPNLV
jgi:hypothetical protein